MSGQGMVLVVVTTSAPRTVMVLVGAGSGHVVYAVSVVVLFFWYKLLFRG